MRASSRRRISFLRSGIRRSSDHGHVAVTAPPPCPGSHRTAFSGLLLLERWSDGIEQRPVALKGDPLRVELQAAQTPELLAASGVAGAPMEQLRQHGAGSHGLSGHLLAADVDAAVIGSDREHALAQEIAIVAVDRADQAAAAAADEIRG